MQNSDVSQRNSDSLQSDDTVEKSDGVHLFISFIDHTSTCALQIANLQIYTVVVFFAWQFDKVIAELGTLTTN